MAVLARISRVRRLLERSIDDSLAPLGINRSGLSVLAALRRSGPPYRLTPTELYRSLLVSSAAMSNRIRRLAAAGLLEQVTDPEDHRRTYVSLTEEGRRLIERAMRVHERNELRLIEGLTEPERATLVRLLRKLLIEMEESGATPPSVLETEGPLSAGTGEMVRSPGGSGSQGEATAPTIMTRPRTAVPAPTT